jgi:hypothetical protein
MSKVRVGKRELRDHRADSRNRGWRLETTIIRGRFGEEAGVDGNRD